MVVLPARDQRRPDGGQPGGHSCRPTDFVHYTDHGMVLPSGGPDAEDFNCYTGSLIDDGDTIHLFYTGNNPNILAADETTQLQQVMHATSEHGLLAWRKHPEHTFAAPPPYDPADWRDPFVYRVAPGQPWRMLLATRHLDGPPRRRGVVAQLISEDLISWTPVEPLWDPRRYMTQECPDVFHRDDWWYLVYSEFSDAFVTRYRMARDPMVPGRRRRTTRSTAERFTHPNRSRQVAGDSSSAGSRPRRVRSTTAPGSGLAPCRSLNHAPSRTGRSPSFFRPR